MKSFISITDNATSTAYVNDTRQTEAFGVSKPSSNAGDPAKLVLIPLFPVVIFR